MPGVRRMPSWHRVLKEPVISSEPVELKVRPVVREEPPLDPRTVAAFIQAEAEAERLLFQARAEAEAIRKEAEAWRERALEEARQAGYQAGYAEGLSEGERIARDMREEASRVLQEALKTREEVLRSIEEEAIELALEIARKVIHQEVKASGDMVLAIARDALQEVISGKSYKLRVSPADAVTVREHKGELEGLLPGGATLQVVSEEDLSPGGCIVETEEERLEATVEGQFEEIAEALRSRAHHGS